MPAAIENEPNVVKIDMNAPAGLVGRVQRVFLRVVGLEPEFRERRLHAVDDLAAELGAALRAPVFETKTAFTSPGLSSRR